MAEDIVCVDDNRKHRKAKAKQRRYYQENLQAIIQEGSSASTSVSNFSFAEVLFFMRPRNSYDVSLIASNPHPSPITTFEYENRLLTETISAVESSKLESRTAIIAGDTLCVRT